MQAEQTDLVGVDRLLGSVGDEAEHVLVEARQAR